MKALEISKDNSVLEKKILNKKTLLIGRSPHCDIVLRSKNIQHVHFILENISDDYSENAVADWSVLDISEKKNQGFGIILQENNKQKLGAFDFRIIEDKLSETHLAKGALKRSLKSDQLLQDDNLTETLQQSQTYVLEVSVLKNNIDSIVDILHYPIDLKKSFIELPHNTQIKIHFSKENKTFNFKSFPENLSISNKFEPIDKSELEKLNFQSNDFIQIESSIYTYFIRLISKETVKIEQKSLFSDKVTQALLISFALFGLILMSLNFLVTDKPLIEPPPPARIVTVEIKNIAAAPTPAPEVVKPAANETQKAEDVTEKMNNPAVSKITEKASSGESRVQKNPDKPVKSGLNNTSQTKNVNTVGILGQLKKSAGSSSSNGKVSADMILNQGIISDVATGKEGSVVIKQSAMGEIGTGKATGGKGNGLAQASTTLSGADVVDSSSAGAIATKGGKSNYSMGQGSGNSVGGNSNNAGNSNGGLLDVDGSGSMTVSGGLSKDQVRKAIGEYRRAIRNCYESALITKSNLQGRLTYKWTISAMGNVSSISLNNTSVNYPPFEDCIENIVRGIQFPIAENKQATMVIYPFVFQGKVKN